MSIIDSHPPLSASSFEPYSATDIDSHSDSNRLWSTIQLFQTEIEYLEKCLADLERDRIEDTDHQTSSAIEDIAICITDSDIITVDDERVIQPPDMSPSLDKSIMTAVNHLLNK